MGKEFAKLVSKMAATKDFAGAIKNVNDIAPREVIPTGSLGLDLALGVGGLPHNRIVEIAGPEGAGKTTLCLNIAKNAMQLYPETNILWLDCEGRFEPDWARQHIPDESMFNRIYVAQPDNAQQATDIYEELVRSGEVSMAVWDSIGGAPSKGDVEKSATIGNVGGNAKAITRFALAAGPLANKYNCLTIGINQVRDKIGARYPTLDTPGGHAWKHACSARIWIKPEAKGAESKFFEKVQGQDVQVGYKIQAHIMKNSFGAPYKSASWWFYNVPCEHGFGIDTVDELVRLSVVFEIVERRGGWYYSDVFPDGKVNGEAKLIALIRDDQAVRESILTATREALRTTDDISEVVGTFDPDNIVEIFEGGAASAPKVNYDNLMAKNAAKFEEDE